MRWAGLILAAGLAFGPVGARAQGGGEAAAWVKAQNDCDRLRAYMKDYPQGRFVGRAREELQRLKCRDPEAEARRAAQARAEAERIAEAERRAREEAQRRADAEAKRARDAEAEARRLKAELDRLKAQPAPVAKTTAPAATPTTAAPSISSDPAAWPLDRLESARGVWLTASVKANGASAAGFYFVVPSIEQDKGHGTGESGRTYVSPGSIVQVTEFVSGTKNGGRGFVRGTVVYGCSGLGGSVAFDPLELTYLGASWRDAFSTLSQRHARAPASRSGTWAAGARGSSITCAQPAAAAPTPAAASADPVDWPLDRLESARGAWLTSSVKANGASAAGFYFVVPSIDQDKGHGTSYSGRTYIAPGSIVQVTQFTSSTQNGGNGYVSGSVVYGCTSGLGSYSIDPRELTYLGSAWRDAYSSLSRKFARQPVKWSSSSRAAGARGSAITCVAPAPAAAPAAK